jgi:hypothetical protein
VSSSGTTWAIEDCLTPAELAERLEVPLEWVHEQAHKLPVTRRASGSWGVNPEQALIWAEVVYSGHRVWWHRAP